MEGVKVSVCEVSRLELDGFWPDPDNSDSGSRRTTPWRTLVTAVCRGGPRVLAFSRHPTGVGRRRSGSVSGAEACAPSRRRERPGGPRVAMQILRHSKIAVTMEIYTEVPSAATREALRKLGQWLDDAPGA